MSKKIKIKSAPGDRNGWNDGTDDLVGCWFEQDKQGQYTLYGPIATGLQSHKDFKFDLKELSWSITDFSISGSSGKASGKWTANDLEQGGNPESGTFQANDTVPVEGESSASANA